MYPVTIITDRYNGAYSGALYLAFNCDRFDIPEAIGDSDLCEMNFWDPTWLGDERKNTAETRFIGRGNTPNEALADLIRRRH